MAKKYNLKLSGSVGGYNFDPHFVDYKLDTLKNEEVLVKIDSLGGGVGPALTISAAFRYHGNVKVHFVGLNASAATIASLGAAHISMEPSAMYLAHKASIQFWEFASLNADQLEDKIKEYQQTKSDLEKFDANIAEMYSRKCKKTKADLLELMKIGGWLTAQEALEWGFIDEVTADDESNPATPQMSAYSASVLANYGIDLPNIPIIENKSAISKIISALAKVLNISSTDDVDTTPLDEIPEINSQSNKILMNKVYTNIGVLLGVQHIALENNATSITDAHLQLIEDALATKELEIANLKSTLNTKDATIVALSKNPAEESSEIVETPTVENSSDFFDTCKKSAELLNSIR